MVLDIVEHVGKKTFTPTHLIMLLSQNEWFCVCGKTLRSYDSNKKNFRNHCVKCKHKLYDISNIIKNSHKTEQLYIGGLLSKEETVKQIKDMDIQQYYGSGNHRKLLKKNLQLFHSIKYNTHNIDTVKGVNIVARMIHLSINSRICNCGESVMNYNCESHLFYPCCLKCRPVLGSLAYFKMMYHEDFEMRFTNDRLARRKRGKWLHSSERYAKKYGVTRGADEYNFHIKRMLDGKKNSHNASKISLTLFDSLMSYGAFNGAMYAGHPKEKMFELDNEFSQKLGQQIIFVDFVYENKIIEFQGDYWHRNSHEKDELRKLFLQSLGYDVLFIYENEYKKDTIKEINKCVRFLKGENVQNRYKILAKSGFVDFDNIVSTGVKNTLKFTTENGIYVEVSEEHIFFVNGKSVIAKTLKVGDILETKNGVSKIKKIEYGVSEVYDVLETDTHTYYANNVLHHNCEFVGSTYTLISASGMKAMKPGTVEEIRDGKLRIYKPPQENHQYIMTVDASKDGEDAFAVQVVDVTDFNFEQVACADLQIDYLLMPEFLNEWCEWYNQPYLIIENNEGAGQSCADVMYQTYEYENLHFDKAQGRNKKKKYPGFRTTSKTRKQILLTMKLFVENSKLKVNDLRTIKEFQRFILINNKYQADTGTHDDMVMSLAMVFVPFCDMKNFEDMKQLVEHLYADEDNEQKISFSELLTIGSFDAGTDEDYEDMISEDEHSEHSEHSDFSPVFVT